MKQMLLPNIYKISMRFIRNLFKDKDKVAYCFPAKKIYFNNKKNQYFFKLSTIHGLICRDIPVDELLANKSILNALDKPSHSYAHYIAGILETLASVENNSIYTFYGLSPFNPAIMVVQSLTDGSVHEWNIIEAYDNELFYNLDKKSLTKFMEIYILAKQNLKNQNTTQQSNALKLVK